MAERIELPSMPAGSSEEQLREMYSYLYRLAQAMNHNLSEIGGMDLTDSEREVMKSITAEEETTAAAGSAGYDWQGKESLKSLIIKTAEFVQNKLNQYRLNLLGEYVTEGKFGRFVRNTQLKVDVTPEGIQQNFTFEEAVQGVKSYTVNAKNYIKTGLLRTVGGIPVYGVAIGKDVVTFSQDGTETYNDGNKVAELTADELSFWLGGNKIASYKGNRIGFYYGSDEVFYISNGEINCNADLTLTSGKDFYVEAQNFKIDSANNLIETGEWLIDDNGIAMQDLSINKHAFTIGSVPRKDWTKYNIEASIDSPMTGIHFDFCDKWDREAKLYFEPYLPGVEDNRPVINIYGDNDVDIHLCGSNRPLRYIRAKECHFGGISGISGGPNSYTEWAYITDVYYSDLHQTSSLAVKKEIRRMEPVGEKLDELEPVTFVYKKDAEGRKRHGLIWEDTVRVLPEICAGNEDTPAEERTINYMELVPMLLKEVQELRARVRMLEAKTGKAEK